jgi:putative oxidoreductase
LFRLATNNADKEDAMGIFDKHENKGKLILRLTVGGLLLLHGIAKMQGGVDWLGGMLQGAGLPAFLRYGVYIGEVIAPILVIVGFFTRPAAAIILINMLVAVLLARRDAMFQLAERGGGAAIELELLFAFGAAAIYCLGSGKFAISRGNGRWD